MKITRGGKVSKLRFGHMIHNTQLNTSIKYTIEARCREHSSVSECESRILYTFLISKYN